MITYYFALIGGYLVIYGIAIYLIGIILFNIERFKKIGFQPYSYKLLEYYFFMKFEKKKTTYAAISWFGVSLIVIGIILLNS